MNDNNSNDNGTKSYITDNNDKRVMNRWNSLEEWVAHRESERA